MVNLSIEYMEHCTHDGVVAAAAVAAVRLHFNVCSCALHLINVRFSSMNPFCDSVLYSFGAHNVRAFVDATPHRFDEMVTVCVCMRARIVDVNV